MCNMLDFSGGSEVKQSACQYKRHGFDPWSGRSHTPTAQLNSPTTRTKPELWSPGATAAEPVTSELILHRKIRRGENPVHRDCRVARARCGQRKVPDASKTQPSQK